MGIALSLAACGESDPYEAPWPFSPGLDRSEPSDASGVVRDTDPSEPDTRDTSKIDTEPPRDTGPTLDTADTEGEAEIDSGCADEDDDGLSDCEEEELCTDPGAKDSDGDGLSDFEELERSLDPCDADTDDDGLEDGRELEFEFEPTNPRTDGETLDGERWVVDACDPPITTERVGFVESRAGNWSLALPPAFDANYRELTIRNGSPSTSSTAAAVYDDGGVDVAGGILSERGLSSMPPSTEVFGSKVEPALSSFGTVELNYTTAAFETHAGVQASRGEYVLSTGEPTTPNALRDELLVELAPFDASRVSNFPPQRGEATTTFRVEFGLIPTKSPTGGQRWTTFSIAPLDAYESDVEVRNSLAQTTSTTNVGIAIDVREKRCIWDRPEDRPVRAEFYWVLDGSGSMYDATSALQRSSAELVAALERTTLDYRFGVTNMDIENSGKLATPPGWHSSAKTFAREVDRRVTSCSETEEWFCNQGAAKFGIQAAEEGLRAMLPGRGGSPNRIRDEAEVFSVMMSDTEPQGRSGAAAYVRQNSTVFSLTAQSGCAEPPIPTGQYRELAFDSGGASSDLCRGEVAPKVRRLVEDAAGIASQFELDTIPISSTIRVYLGGKWVPRNRENGYAYHPRTNSIAFYGDYRPEGRDEGEVGTSDYISVSFERFQKPTANP